MGQPFQKVCESLSACIKITVFVLLIAIGVAPHATHAHQTGESYIYLNVAETTLSGRYEVPLQDLQLVFDRDLDGDGILSQQEYAVIDDEVRMHFAERFSFDIGGVNSKPHFTSVDFFDITPDWVLLSFDVDWSGGQIPEEIGINHRSSWQDVDPNHRVLVLIESNERTGLKNNEAQHSIIFTTGAESAVLDLTGATPFEAFSKFVGHGIHHLIIGFDHIAFILALVLPSVLVVIGGKWAPAPDFRTALWSIIKIATTFTIAHSITLTLAALDMVRLPSTPVEAFIALSIVAAALSNIFLIGRKWVYPLIFSMGLLHGLGFANVLAPLALEPLNTLPSLLGFNIGVELGQIAILLPPFLLLFTIREWSGYQTVVLKGGSAILTVVAVYWFAERAVGSIVRILGL